MSLKINIAVAFLAFSALCIDAYIVQRRIRQELPVKNLQYACPKSSNWVTPEMVLSPVEVALDSLNGGKTKKQFTVAPLLTRLVENLEMVVLPSREVCVLGEKLKNYIMPENSQFEIMLSIAAWCLPCISEPIHTQRSHCLEQKLNAIGANDNTRFQEFSERLVAAIQEYFFYNNFLFFID